jgi:hypothetical protein
MGKDRSEQTAFEHIKSNNLDAGAAFLDSASEAGDT